jgi:S1-C subfamily serine protease
LRKARGTVKLADLQAGTACLAGLRVGNEAKLDIVRNGRPRTLRATISEPEEARADAGRMSDHLAGAVPGDLQPGHPLAGRAGLRAGDVIVSINRQAVNTLAKVPAAAKHSSERLLLNIGRGNAALFLVIR